MEGAVITEVVFTPGEARMRLLTWLAGRYGTIMTHLHGMCTHNCFHGDAAYAVLPLYSIGHSESGEKVLLMKGSPLY